MKKFLALTLAFCMVFSFMAASASAEGEKTKITVLRPGDTPVVESIMVPFVEKFEAENPDIDVEIMYESWGGWIQTFPTYFESGTQPDVIWWWDNKQNDVSAKGHLINLKDYIDDSVFELVPDSVWNATNVSGSSDVVYYFPGTVDPFVLYYNKAVVAEAGLDPEAPPTTWDELLAWCEAIAANTDVDPIGVPAKAGMETLQEFVTFFVNQATGCADMIDENNQPTFNNEKGLEAFEFLEKLWQYIPEDATEATRGDLRTILANGDVAMLIDHTTGFVTYEAAFGEDDWFKTSVGVCEPPLGSAGKVTWAGTNGWVATREETAEASCRFIEFLMQPEQEAVHHNLYGGAPLEEGEFALNPKFNNDAYQLMYNVINEYSLCGMIGKYHPTPSAFYTQLEEVWQEFMLGGLSAQEAIDAAVEVIAEINARQGITG